MKKFIFIFVCIATFQLLPCNAWAYIDPGSGSLLLQVVIAGILGAVFTVKTFFRRFFPKKSGQDVAICNEKSDGDINSNENIKNKNVGNPNVSDTNPSVRL